MPPITKNLGLVRAIHEGVNPPLNIKMLWYNTNPSENRHYYYDTVDLMWKPLTGSGSGTPTIYTFTDSSSIDFNQSGTNVTASVKVSPDSGNIIQAISSGLFANETLTALTGLTLTGQTLNAFYRDEEGTTTARSVDLSSAFVDVNIANATFDPNTYILTITESDGSTHTVNLSELIRINVVDSFSIDFSGNGTAGSPLSGSVKVAPLSDNILQTLSNGLYVPNPIIPIAETPPIQLPKLQIKIKSRTQKIDNKERLKYDEGNKAYDDIFVSWDQDDKRFLNLKPKIYLFVYRNHKGSDKNKDSGSFSQKIEKGYVHPTDKFRREIRVHDRWDADEKAYRGLDKVLDWDDYSDITNNKTNKSTVFKFSSTPKQFFILEDFEHYEWFYLHQIVRDENGKYKNLGAPHFNMKKTTPANLYSPYLKGYLKCLTTHGSKNAPIKKVVDTLNKKGSPKYRENVWMKFAVVCENPNPKNSTDKYLIGPLSEAVCMSYHNMSQYSGGEDIPGTGKFRIHPEHKKIKWGNSGTDLYKDDSYKYIARDGVTQFHDIWNHVDINNETYPMVRYRRYGDVVRIDGCCLLNLERVSGIEYIPGRDYLIFSGLSGNYKPEQPELLFNVPCLIDGGIEIVTVKITNRGELFLINLPESRTFVLYLDGIEYYVNKTLLT